MVVAASRSLSGGAWPGKRESSRRGAPARVSIRSPRPAPLVNSVARRGSLYRCLHFFRRRFIGRLMT
ncbi:unnamed protein product [Leptosia nina]|uniref:Uncharacterized protein n=1 Tax=Leptosia nina TaxID=320188 RepID=A0AAV1J032_9NEOP